LLVSASTVTQAVQNELSHPAQSTVHSLQTYRLHLLHDDEQSLQT